jgi:hypothetical protein
MGVSLSAVSTTNVEYHEFHNVTVAPLPTTSAWGYGFVNGPSANAKGQLFSGCSVSWATSGFYLKNGSAHIDRCTGTGNGSKSVPPGVPGSGADVQLDNYTDVTTISRCDFEQSGAAVQVTNSSGQLVIAENRWGGVKGPYVFNIHGSGTSFRSNNVGLAPPAGAPPTQAFYPYGFESGFTASFSDGLWANSCIDNRYQAFRPFTVSGVETWRPF